METYSGVFKRKDPVGALVFGFLWIEMLDLNLSEKQAK